MSALLAAVRRGDVAGTAAELAGLTAEQRRAELPELTALRREQRPEWWAVPADVRAALMIAGTACHSAPAAAAGWLGGQDFRAVGNWDRPELRAVLDALPVRWRSAVAARLAERPARSWGWTDFQLLEHLVLSTGMAVPVSDAFVTEWLRHRRWWHAPARPRLLWERLEHDPFVAVLVPRLFEVPETGAQLVDERVAAEDRWTSCLVRLAERGTVERADLIERCLARLLRGGRANDQRGFLALLQELAPTPAENTGHLRSYLALLDGLSTVAGHAQRVLVELDTAGLLGPDLLTEAAERVLFRTEKKLVKAQLSWLDRSARRDPRRAGAVVLAAAGAFGHPDRSAQEGALKVVARHLKAAGDAVLPELRAAAGLLDPAHHARAAELLGVRADRPEEPYQELLPPPPVPRPLPGPLGSPAEVAEELAALLQGDLDPAAFERTLDGLVRHAHLDRAALADALEPVLQGQAWASRRWADCTPADLLYVAAAATGRLAPDQILSARGASRSPLRGQRLTVFGAQLAARLEEAAWQVRGDPPPYLLAPPTDTTGALAADALVERLAGYEAAGLTPGEVDLGQAMLRVTLPAPAAAEAAAELTSPAGRRLAAWLREGGLPHLDAVLPTGPAEPGHRPGRLRWWHREDRRASAPKGCAPTYGLPADAARLVSPQPAGRCPVEGFWFTAAAHWTAMLPGHRESVAARLREGLAGAAGVGGYEDRGAPQALPLLAESGGPAGPALHLVLGYGLGTRFPEDRAAAVDALLVLAARGDLDGALLGTALARLARAGELKTNRLAAALRSAADTGAYRTVWSVLAPALPALLADKPVHAAADLLALAVDCARRCAARGPIPEVTALAERGGGARLVKEATSLAQVLAAQGAPESA
ncbi:DUF6493 family protein [Kitasatospora sp. NPDC049258]|uniref:DUF7825 domain-containing protein n=1 Tax=Kitasatospora sp. NPDC049258 TaxID=3155394 RepID=UPI00342CD7BB